MIKRRTHSPEFKARVAMEAISGRKTIQEFAAGLALLAAEGHGLVFREWVLVAPTWRGPFPTMARRRCWGPVCTGSTRRDRCSAG